jgi:hypothetical protein
MISFSMGKINSVVKNGRNKKKARDVNDKG